MTEEVIMNSGLSLEQCIHDERKCKVHLYEIGHHSMRNWTNIQSSVIIQVCVPCGNFSSLGMYVVST